MKLKHDVPLSNFSVKCNLRRYIKVITMIVARTLDLNPVLVGAPVYASLRSNILRVMEAVDIQVGRCRLTLSNTR